MDIDSYMRNYSITEVNQDTLDWEQDYFLMLDDPQTAKTTLPATDNYCAGCTRHILKVKNEGAKA